MRSSFITKLPYTYSFLRLGGAESCLKPSSSLSALSARSSGRKRRLWPRQSREPENEPVFASSNTRKSAAGPQIELIGGQNQAPVFNADLGSCATRTPADREIYRTGGDARWNSRSPPSSRSTSAAGFAGCAGGSSKIPGIPYRSSHNYPQGVIT